MSDTTSKYNDLCRKTHNIVDISTIFVPYSPADNPDSKRWAILGTYSQKTTEQLQHNIAETEENTNQILNEKLLQELIAQYENNPSLDQEELDLDKKKIYRITSSDQKNALNDLIEFNDEIHDEEEAHKWLQDRGVESLAADDNVINIESKETIQEGTEEESTAHKDGYVDTPPWDDEFWDDDKNVVFLLRSALIHKHKEKQEAKMGTSQQLLSMSVPASHAGWTAVQDGNVMSPNMLLTGINTVIFTILAFSYKTSNDIYDELLKLDSQDHELKKNPDFSKKKRMRLLKNGLQHLGIGISSIKPTTPEEFKHQYHDIIEDGRKRGHRPPKNVYHNDILNAGNNIRNTTDKQAHSITDKLLAPFKTLAAYTMALSSGGEMESTKSYINAYSDRLKSSAKNTIAAPIALVNNTDIKSTRQSLSYICRTHAPRLVKNMLESAKDKMAFGALTFQESWNDIRHLKKSKSGLTDGLKGWGLKSEHDHATLRDESHQTISKIQKKSIIVPHSEIMHTQKALESIKKTEENLEELKNYKGIKAVLPKTNFALATGANTVSIGSLAWGIMKLDPVNVAVNTWDLLMGGIGANFKTGSILYQHAREKNSFLAQASENKEDLVKHKDIIYDIADAQTRRRVDDGIDCRYED